MPDEKAPEPVEKDPVQSDDAGPPPRTDAGIAVDKLIAHEREFAESVESKFQRLSKFPKTAQTLFRSKVTHLKEDSLAGTTSAIANVPGDMATGVLAGVNPVHGLYTLMIGLPVAAIFTSTRRMMFDATSAMTLVAVAGIGSISGDDRVNSLIVITLIAGVFQIALGVLGLGFLTRFVSNSVMIGFLTGIAILIILGQLWDLTGFEGEGGSKLKQTVELIGHLSEMDPWTSVVGIGSVAALFLLNYTPLRQFNLLVVLAVATAVSQLPWFDSVVLVNSLGDIPRALPTPHIPELRLIPSLALTGVAVGVVGLLQAAGVAQQYPNDGGKDPDDSRDFMAQGIANVATSMFRGLPGGGSVSGTALNEAAGAKTRVSLFVQAIVVIVLVLVLSDLLSIIPMAALAAILVYSAILAIKPKSIATVFGTGRSSSFTLMATLVATLIVPLQQAVVLGVVLAGVLYIYRSSNEVRIVQLKRNEAQRIIEVTPPNVLSSNEITVLDTYGSLFYAGARTLGQNLPKTEGAKNAVVLLRIRGYGDLGSTFLSVMSRYAGQLRDGGGALLLAGVDPKVFDRMKRSGHLDSIGPENVFVAGEAIYESSESALARAQDMLQRRMAAAQLETAGAQ